MEQGVDCKGRQWTRRELVPRMKDLTNKKNFQLTWLFPVYVKGRKKTDWLCRCECGNYIVVRSTCFVTQKSCGCKKHNPESPKKIKVGDVFTYLTVIDVDDTNYCTCRCKCGTILKVRNANLRYGTSTSCGCRNKETITEAVWQDETGKRYGKLTVLGLAYKDIQGSHWRCKCDCGTEVITRGSALRSGTSSCGCIRSKGERQIASLLSDNNITYIKQYNFNDLRGPQGGVLLFDFGITNNNQLVGLLEYNGIQHYIDSNFGKVQREITDKQKIDYCKEHNIPLLILNKDNYDEKMILEWIKNITRESEGEKTL